MSRRRKGGIKKREIDLASALVPVFSTAWNTERFTELCRGEKGEGGNRGDLVEKKESQKGEGAIRPVISLPSKNGY